MGDAVTGRPSSYSESIATAICDQLSNGKSLRAVCEQAGMPNKKTVLSWLAKNEPFRAQYEIAKEESADLHAEEILEIADQEPPLGPDGKVDSGAVQHLRLRVDARKWIAAKLKPRKYGEKQQLEHSGSIDLGLADRLAKARERSDPK